LTDSYIVTIYVTYKNVEWVITNDIYAQ